MPPLSDAAIRRIKPSGRTQRLFDSGGLYLEVTPRGSLCWRQKYRFAGKEKRLAHGIYPDVPLSLARTRRDEARRLLAQGMDPADQKKAAAAALETLGARTFKAIAVEWMAKRKWVASYRVKVEAYFNNDVFPWIGSRDADTLEAADFLAIARRIEERGSLETAHRTTKKCGEVMRYAVATQRAKRNPVPDLQGALAPVEKGHFAAITKPDDLAPFLRALHGYRGTPMTRAALKLAPLVFVRPIELRTAEWSEFDLDAAEWNVPAAKIKTRIPLLVPLARQAVEILRELHPLTGRGRYVFAGVRTPKRPMSSNTVLAAIRALGYDKAAATGHGFRATARTILDEKLKFRPDIIDHQLAHVVKDTNGRAYNRTAFIEDRIAMMQRWADYLDELRTAPPAAGGASSKGP